MHETKVETLIAKILAIGALFTTIFILTSTNTDPVNVTKLFLLGALGISSVALTVGFRLGYILSNFKLPILASGLFVISMIFANLFSGAPFSQTFYGAYGRNNGLLTYLLFTFVMIGALALKERKSFIYLVWSLIAAATINAVYSGWVLLFGDFIGWTNPYGNILGLFGNPDFISAFLGISIAVSVALLLAPETRFRMKILILLFIVLSLFEILKSHAIQGLVVTVGGIAIAAFYKIRSIFKSNLVWFTYLALAGVVGLCAIAGTLQRGPFSFLYKPSVSLRGSYWHAGMEMGFQNPLNGIGLDSYGDWYRRTRPPVALVDTPGINTVSNVAHNVIIDFFASGGFPLLISYLFILCLGLWAIVRVSVRRRNYDWLFVSLTSGWLCYEVQSVISINQIGLALWGWLLTGALIAYERVDRNRLIPAEKQQGIKVKNQRAGNSPISPQLVAGTAMVFGLILAAPPINADAKWFSALNSQDLNKIEVALKPGFMNPANTFKYLQAVDLMERSKLFNKALSYQKVALQFNPDDFNSWRQLYFLTNSTDQDRALALKNMKRLDPRNPDVTSTK